jgi:hypothetical protein
MEVVKWPPKNDPSTDKTRRECSETYLEPVLLRPDPNAAVSPALPFVTQCDTSATRLAMCDTTDLGDLSTRMPTTRGRSGYNHRSAR